MNVGYGWNSSLSTARQSTFFFFLFFPQSSALKVDVIYNRAFYMHEFPQEHPGVKNNVNLLVALSKIRYVPARSSLFEWSPGAVSGHGWCRRSQCVVLGAGYCMGITWISFLWCEQSLEVNIPVPPTSYWVKTNLANLVWSGQCQDVEKADSKMVVAPSPGYHGKVGWLPLLAPTTLTRFWFLGRVHHLKKTLKKCPGFFSQKLGSFTSRIHTLFHEMC